MESKFLSALILQDDSGLPYTLYAALRYQSAGLTTIVEVPVGFQTDLASIPRALWNLLPKSGPYDRAAVIHDALYGWGSTSPRGVPITRGQADSTLLEAMRCAGVGRFTRTVIYLGVRVGGWRPWGEYRGARPPAGVA